MSALAAHYSNSDQRGRPTIGLERVRRMCVVQEYFGLSDEEIEYAIYDSRAIQRFMGVDLNRGAAPLLKFRRLLESHDLTKTSFKTINQHLPKKGLLMREGSIVDATLIAVPSSNKNDLGERDPEIHQTKKGNKWHFGMRAHNGVDAESRLVHTKIEKAATVNDVTQVHVLLHGEETDALFELTGI